MFQGLFDGWIVHLVVGIVCFFLGGVCTRWLLRPRMCPRCHYYMNWRTTLQEKAKNKEPWDIT